MHCFGDTEIGEKNFSTTGDENVPRFDVAMHDSLVVCMLQCQRNRATDVHGESRTESCRSVFGVFASCFVENFTQALAVDELHDHESAVTFFDDVVDRNDVLVMQLRECLRFATESFDNCFVVSDVILEVLHRDLSTELNVGREPHFCHATSSN